MAEIFEPMSETEPRTGDAYRGAVLDALRGAAKRGWLGPEVELEPSTESVSDRLLELDLLALSVQSAVERVTLPLARTARALVQARIWSQFGYARIEDYARERVGRTGRWLRDQASLGRSFEDFAELSAAFVGEDGGRPLGKLRTLLVGRVASAASVGAWIELARSVTVRELKEIVRNALRHGSDRPLVDSESPADGKGFCGTEGSPKSTFGRETSSCQEHAYGDGSSSDEQPEEASCERGNSEFSDADACVDLDERCRLRMAAPVAVRAAFDETLWLQRSVSGREGSVTSFVEALVAEAHAGPQPPDDGEDVELDYFVRRHGADAGLEQRLAKRTKSWADLPGDVGPESSSALAADALARFEVLARRAGQGDAAELDRQLRGLVELEDELERRLGRLLRELHDCRAWRRLSFAGMGHYAEQRLGLGRTAAEDRARLARVLNRYPRLAQAYDTGRVGMESARIVVRILSEAGSDAAVERAWVERAEQATVKRMRDELRALRRQQAYEDRPGPVVPLDDAAWHGSLMQRPGEMRARVHDLAARAVASGHPDVFLRLTLPADLAQGFLAAVESARRTLVEQAPTLAAPDEGQVAGPISVGEGNATELRGGVLPASLLAARMFSAAGRIVPAWVGLLALLEDFVDTWDLPEGMPRRRAGEVYAREGWRCFAPACTSRCNLEDHHLEYKSRGGDATAMWNQLCVCAFHHRPGEHGGLASCRGEAPLNVLWRLGRSDLGVWFRNERRLQ